MNKKISLGAAVAFMLIVATATFSMTMFYATATFNQKVAALKEREVEFEKFSEIASIIRMKYYGSIKSTQLMDSVAKGYIAGLGDPYAMYIDAREYDRILRGAEGSLAGIGAVMEANVSGDGYLSVVQVYADSPAQAEGMEAGDLIVKIDDTDLTPENSAQMLESVQGEAGTRISMVVRKGTEEILIEMTRRQVAVPSVHSRLIPDTNVGYIWIEEFNDNTSDQFNRELQKLISGGAGSLVIDLRDNKGGLLRQATRILDRLCPAGLLASYTPRTGDPVEYPSDANEIDMPMVVLVNAESASASELFAQTIRAFGKGKVVGATTAGKGVIQSTEQLSDGSAIVFTIAELLGPNGESFNKEGVKPDYEVSLAPEENWREMDHETDAQLKKAIEVVVGLKKANEVQEEPEEPVESGEEPDGGSLVE